MEFKKYGKYISKGIDTTKSFLESHSPTGAKLGPAYTLLGEEVIPDSDVRVAVRQILRERISSEYPDYIGPHIHDVSKAYIILSEVPEDIEADVTLGEEEYTIKSPAAVFVPVGVEHKIRIKKGNGFMIIIMPTKGTYNEHTFPVSKDKAR
jgi:hypothetical protein